MTDNGNAMDLADAVSHMKGMRVDRARFMELFAAEEAARTNGKTNGKKHPKGSWVQEESHDITLNTMFHDGPICLWHISRRKVTEMQNNYLINACTFLKKKYPENWDVALQWVNMNVLQPIGNTDKLNDIIKRFKHQDYEYMCHDEPICSHCHPQACRKQTYGVGANGVDYYEMGMTIIERVPAIYFINAGDTRMMFEHQEIANQSKYRDKFVAYGLSPPPRMKNDEWDRYLKRSMEDATRVLPTRIMRTNAAEIDFMTTWLTTLIPGYMRVGSKGMEDAIRVKVEERRIYFKDYKLMRFCAMCNFDDKGMRRFIDANCQYNDRKTHREWWRCTYSISFDMFDEEIIEKWMAADTDEGVSNDRE
jgi:hypothetical protein